MPLRLSMKYIIDILVTTYGLFTRKSDFALGLLVYSTNNIFLYYKWTSLLRNCAPKSDM
jgi:hypothetical protein